MIELYDYQKQYINALRLQMKQGNKRLVLCAPTGSGKTIMFSYMVKNHIDKGGRVIVFTHRVELLTQAGGSFEKFGLKPEFIKPGVATDLSSPLHIAMIETYNRRKEDYSMFMEQKTLVIIDESHLQNFTKILDEIPKGTYVIGATATPYRNPNATQMGDFYTSIVQELDTQDVIDLDKLTPAKSYGVPIDMKGLKKKGDDYDTSEYYEENKTYVGVVKNWEKHSKNEKTILFSSNIKSSKEVCDEFILKGYNAKHIDGKTSKKERPIILDWFKNTPDAILCNCGILTSGFDQSDILTVILYRATTSLPLFLQMCGRGSRISENKTHFKILDFGNNIERLGFWEENRKWELFYKKKSKKEQEAPKKICPKCDAVNPSSAKECIICEWAFPKPKPTEEEVILQELKRLELKGRKLSELYIGELIQLQKLSKYKATFIWRIIRSKGTHCIEKYASLMEYSDGWVYRQKQDIRNSNFTDLTI